MKINFNWKTPFITGFVWKRLLITTFLIIFASGIIAGLTWYLMNENAKKEKEATDKSIQALENTVYMLKGTNNDENYATELESTEVDTTFDGALLKTSTWKTYVNTVYGFNFKYPDQGYTVSVHKISTDDPKYLLYHARLEENIYINTYEYPGILGVEIWDAKGKTNFTEWLDSSDELGNKKMIYYRDGSLKAISNTGVFKFAYLDDGMVTTTSYALLKNNRVFIFNVMDTQDFLAQTVLNSFKLN
jgi:uncharacterized protein YuzE